MSLEFLEESQMLELWNTALSELRGRLSAENFDTWLSTIRFDGIENNIVKLSVPNRFSADWIRAHYLDLILESLCKKTGHETLEVRWTIDASLSTRDHAIPTEPVAPPNLLLPAPPVRSRLTCAYTPCASRPNARSLRPVRSHRRIIRA